MAQDHELTPARRRRRWLELLDQLRAALFRGAHSRAEQLPVVFGVDQDEAEHNVAVAAQRLDKAEVALALEETALIMDGDTLIDRKTALDQQLTGIEQELVMAATELMRLRAKRTVRDDRPDPVTGLPSRRRLRIAYLEVHVPMLATYRATLLTSWASTPTRDEQTRRVAAAKVEVAEARAGYDTALKGR